MKKALGLVLMLALIALPALAGDKDALVKPASNDVQLGTMHALNNVYSDNDGHKMALCGCGKEFEVTAESPKMEPNGMTFYCCSKECHDMASKATPEVMSANMMSWQKNFETKDMASNVMVKDGKKMATCACGQIFEVSDATPIVAENGMKLDACCQGCAEHVMKATPEDRAAMMKKAMYTPEKKN